MTHRAALGLAAWRRRPRLQDAALACGLFVVCLPINDPFTLVQAAADHPVGGGWSGPGAVWVWWVGAALTVVSVTLRRRQPIPMLVLCVLSTSARLATVVPATVMDLAVLILLYTVTAQCPRIGSLFALGGLLAVGAAWVSYDALAKRPLPMSTAQVCNRAATLPAPGRAGAVTVDCHGGSNIWNVSLVLGSGLIASWAAGFASHNRRAYLEQLHARAQDLERERDQGAALAVAAERGRISREVHDVVAHGLSLIVVQAQGAEAALDNHPADTHSALQTIVKAGRDSLADMRRVLAALGDADDTWHPPPGLAQLANLLTRVRQAGTAVNLRVEGPPTALPATVDLSAYRIVQEALTNVMKHAGAGAAANVVVNYGHTELGIEVRDDGHGAIGNGNGNGLPGMHRRVTLLGGQLSAQPGSHGGFVIQATLPIQGPDA
jgi:signal transduction histidine kinase